MALSVCPATHFWDSMDQGLQGQAPGGHLPSPGQSAQRPVWRAGPVRGLGAAGWGGGACARRLSLTRRSLLQAEAAVAAVAVADTVRDGPPSRGPDGVSRMWGRGGACTTALVSPAPGTPAAGSAGPSAAASFFVRYVARGPARLRAAWVGTGVGVGVDQCPREPLWVTGRRLRGTGSILEGGCQQPGGPCPSRGPWCVGLLSGSQEAWLCPGRPAGEACLVGGTAGAKVWGGRLWGQLSS